jgi:hypothetical protein
MRGALTTLIAAALLVPAAAAAAPIPGAHYTGTTDQGFGFSFDVAADGTTITNVAGSATAPCTGGPGGTTNYAFRSSYAFPVANNVISGEDPAYPYLVMRGQFSSAFPQQAAGTFDATYGAPNGDGSFYYCNALGQRWEASTSAEPPGGFEEPGDPDGGGLPAGGNPGPVGPPVVSIALPKPLKLKPSLAKGFAVTVGVDQASTLVGKLTLAAKDAKRYRLGKKARAIASASATSAGPATPLQFKVARKIAEKLKTAKKLKLRLDVTATRADGASGRASRTLAFS